MQLQTIVEQVLRHLEYSSAKFLAIEKFLLHLKTAHSFEKIEDSIPSYVALSVPRLNPTGGLLTSLVPTYDDH